MGTLSKRKLHLKEMANQRIVSVKRAQIIDMSQSSLESPYCFIKRGYSKTEAHLMDDYYAPKFRSTLSTPILAFPEGSGNDVYSEQLLSIPPEPKLFAPRITKGNSRQRPELLDQISILVP